MQAGCLVNGVVYRSAGDLDADDVLIRIFISHGIREFTGSAANVQRNQPGPFKKVLPVDFWELLRGVEKGLAVQLSQILLGDPFRGGNELYP